MTRDAAMSCADARGRRVRFVRLRGRRLPLGWLWSVAATPAAADPERRQGPGRPPTAPDAASWTPPRRAQGALARPKRRAGQPATARRPQKASPTPGAWSPRPESRPRPGSRAAQADARPRRAAAPAARQGRRPRSSRARDRVDEIAAATLHGRRTSPAQRRSSRSAIRPQDFVDRPGLRRPGDAEAAGRASRPVRQRGRRSRTAQNAPALAKRAADAAQAAGGGRADARRPRQTARRPRPNAQRWPRWSRQRQDALKVAESERAATEPRYREPPGRGGAHRGRAAARWRRSGGGTGRCGPARRLLMPVHGWKSSDFGKRYDPYYQVWQLHAGIDIAAGGGTPIYAAAAGKVIRAGGTAATATTPASATARTRARASHLLRATSPRSWSATGQ